jgi:hypothetical protein
MIKSRHVFLMRNVYDGHAHASMTGHGHHITCTYSFLTNVAVISSSLPLT